MKATWKNAVSATLHCLTGCAVGEIIGMSVGVALHWTYLQKVLLAIPLAFLCGYALTIHSLRKVGISFRKSLPLAAASDTLSIASMELVDNIVILLIPRSMDAGLTPRYWISLLISLTCAFLIAVPINRWLISRGLGHAKIHQFHSHMDHMKM